MEIHHSEFYEMFEFLKEETPISLKRALEKWKRLKSDAELIKIEWIKLLEENSSDLMNEGYSIGTAMLKAWDILYISALEDCENSSLSISILRETFFEESLYKLEKYEDSLIDNEKYSCKDCGWFVVDYLKSKGHCNNFNLEKSVNSNCITTEEL